MKINDIIRHTMRVRAVHAPLNDSMVSKLAKLGEAVGEMDVAAAGHDIVSAVVKAWKGSSPSTVRRYLVQLRAVFRRARIDGIVEREPYLELPPVYDVRTPEVSVEEADLILDNVQFTRSRRWAYPGLLLLCHTGARLGELVQLRGRDVTPNGVVIRKPVARRSKTVSRLIPLSRRLADALNAGHYRTDGSPFRGSYGLLTSGRSVSSVYGRVVAETCDDLGLPHVRLHDLRHLFAERIANVGGDLADIASLLGHTNLGTTLRYRGLVKNKARELIASI